mmetsp:Transcript_15704/g.63246  ORF Transcript_15704/g.63246 Transcript_15704/m.63246 type:complete len:301 (+) Transcript_15704:81-983(+)
MHRKSLVASLVVALITAADAEPQTGGEPLWVHPLLSPANLSTYEPPAGLNYTFFVILTMPRSASQEVLHALNDHPSVHMDGEIFRQGGVDFNGSPEHRLFVGPEARWTREARDADRTAFLRDVVEGAAPRRKRGARARGFKCMNNQLQVDELRLLTRAKHVLKIVLRRQDTLARHVSLRRASLVGEFLRPRDAGVRAAFEATRVEVSLTQYEHFAAIDASWYDWLAEESVFHPESWLFVSTERLVSDSSTMSAIYAHLRVPPGSGFPGYHPYTTDVLEDKVTNWEEIRELRDELVIDNVW